MVVKRGFFLGKFMPPHAGHISLIEAARQLVDQMTVLVCWLPGDPINGELRLKWMQQLFPDCRVVGHGAVVPQFPWDSDDFWPIWRGIVRQVHPEPIDYLFAGEDYGADLAREVGGLFVPLGGRVLGANSDPIGGLTATAIRANPTAHWPLLPQPVRQFYQKRVCLHGSESTGKSTLSALLASHYGTLAVGEYGRSHCEAHPEALTADDLMLIGKAQHAMIDAAAPWAGPLLIADTDALMTAAWSEMLLDTRIEALLHFPKADLYLLMEPDIPWVDDGTRYFSKAEDRLRFIAIVEEVLTDAKVPFARIGGTAEKRESSARQAIESMMPQV